MQLLRKYSCLQEKKPYVDKAMTLKAEYAISIEKWNTGEEFSFMFYLFPSLFHFYL